MKVLGVEGYVRLSERLGGKLALWWKEDIDVALQSFSKGHIDVIVWSGPENHPWFSTGSYGHLETEVQKALWQLLHRIGEGCTLPWLCGRDFNKILYTSVKRGMKERPQL